MNCWSGIRVREILERGQVFRTDSQGIQSLGALSNACNSQGNSLSRVAMNEESFRYPISTISGIGWSAKSQMTVRSLFSA